MCFICIEDYDIDLSELNCNKCNKIKEIPKGLVNLRNLDISNTQIKEIPKELINLNNLWCDNTKIKEIPKELINLNYIYCNADYIWDKSWHKTENEINNIIPLQKFWKRNGKFIVKLPTLWKIDEYYSAKNYSPENIMKYVNLD
jgi:Leucine-rich repeat (LRR) protein